MKKYSLIVVWLFVVCLGCSELREASMRISRWMEPNGKIKILCTTAPVASLAKAVGGDEVDVLPLMAESADPHSYEIVKGDDQKFRVADVVLASGLGLESQAALSRMLMKYHAFYVGDAIVADTKNAIVLGKTTDPHLWMDLSLWAEGSMHIARLLSERFPEKAALFQRNAEETYKRLQALHHRIRQQMQAISPQKRYLVTTHDAFRYFCRAYLGEKDDDWIDRSMAPEGLSPESQMSLHDIRLVTAYIHDHNIQVVFSEFGATKDSLSKIVEACRACGDYISISEDSLFSDTLGPGCTYEETMEHNVETIAKSL